jgi:pimeloyl-ACP methyl ester carboxylesterase
MGSKVYKSDAGKLQILNFYETILKKWPVPCEHMKVDTRYGNTFVIASGGISKEPVLLLHGSSTNSAMWMGDIVRLSKDFRVYAVDIIGEPGKSDESRPELQPQNYSDWILDVLEALNIEQASLVGNSLGGWMSLCFATKNPERVRKLVLIASSGIASEKKSFLFKVIGLSLLGQKGIDKINKIVYGNLEIPEEVVRFGRLVFNNFIPRMGGLHVFSDNELRNLTMPTFFIAGEKDALLNSTKAAVRLSRILDSIKIDIKKDEGHVIINRSGEIVDFLNEICH